MIRFLLVSALLFVSGCGFKPLYATNTEDSLGGSLEQVALGPIRGSVAPRDVMRETLSERFSTGEGDERYLISVDLRDVTRAVSVTIDSNARRFNYQLTATINYLDRETDETRRQTLQTVVSFAVTPSQYATLIGQEDATRRAVIDLTRKIETDAALYVQGRAPAEARGSIFSGDSQRDPIGNIERREEEEAREAAREAAEQQTPPAEGQPD
ncbi:MAG: hypothetical protein AAGH41_12575 [Pseudomonadota bacterium]